MGRFNQIVLVSLFGISLFSCEKEQSGVIDNNLIPPSVISVSLRDTTVNLDDTTSSAVIRSNGRFTITDSVIVTVSDPSGIANINQVSYRLFRPNASYYFNSGKLNLVSTNINSAIFSRKISFVMNRTEAGLFKVEIYAVGKTNLISNSVVTSLFITRTNSKPIITNISMPDSVTIGALSSPDSTFLVTATATDSDGVSDVYSIKFYSLKPDSTYANNGNPINLYDDGSKYVTQPPNGRSGDLFDGDGIFSQKVLLLSAVPNPNPPPDTFYTQRGNYTFTFRAYDNNGTISDSVVRIIKVK